MSKWLSYKTKGSIMGLVITMSMLIMLLSLMFSLRSQLDAKASFLSEENDRLLNNAQSGLQWLLSGNSPVPLNGNLTTDLFGEGTDSVYLERKAWGVFEIVLSKAFHDKKSFVTKAMVGSGTDSLAPTLYVCDLEKPISVCGQTRLVGKCYVPTAGFKRAYIEGQNYQGDKYVYGTQLKSNRELPAINKNLLASIVDQLNYKISGMDSLTNLSALENDSLVQPFDKKTICFIQGSPIRLPGIYLEGNIRLIAPKIYISRYCQLKNIVLAADEVIIEDDCTLQVQAFARKHIETGKNVQLHYPSVLAVVEDQPVAPDDNEEQKPSIHLGEGTTITGDLIAWKEDRYLQSETWIGLDKETQVNGQVYSSGKLDVKGRIYGSTYCHKFYLKTNSGTYENHLLNAELDASKLPAWYTGANVLHEGTKREILQWL